MKNELMIFGHGPRKVMVMNGWLGLSQHWVAMLEAMDPDEFECVVFEYRGYGQQRSRTGEFTFLEAASDAIALADTLNWPTFSLIGHSMGGMAMQRVALQAQHRIHKLLGIAPVSAAGSLMDDTRLALFESAVNDLTTRQTLLQFSTGQRLTQTWCKQMAIDSQVHEPQAVRGYLHEWTNNGFAHLVSDLNVPVKILVGEFDPSINAARAAHSWGTHYPDIEIVELAQTAHYPMMELPLTVAAHAENWLRQ